MRFVDTNVLLYAISTRADERHKAEIAASLLKSRDLALSIQVLQEFYVQATRPSSPVRIHHDAAVAYMKTFARYPIAPITQEVLEAALDVTARWQIGYWDAAIIAAARTLGCDTLLTEDLQHGQRFGGLRIVDPFR